MDRSLKVRTSLLVGMILFCLGVLAPSFGMSQDWVPQIQPVKFLLRHLFASRINLGLDLQGGKHIVYNIDLDKAIDDKASHLKLELDARLADDKIKGSVRTPPNPLGAVTVTLDDVSKRDELKSKIETDYNDHERVVEWRDCPSTDPNAANELCLIVSKTYADGIKATALKNAVATVGDRINASGVAEASVVTKDDDIIVELPGDPKSDSVLETEALIARTAKLEMKVVDDCSNVTTTGCTQSGMHNGSKYMLGLFQHVGHDATTGDATDPEALKLAITVDVDQWRPEDGGGLHTDYFLKAYNREIEMPYAWVKKHGKLKKDAIVEDGKVKVELTGREIIERYMFGDKGLDYPGLIASDKAFALSDDHQLGFEEEAPAPGAKETRKFWRTYYLERAVRLTGSDIENAVGIYDPNTLSPIVQLDFNRAGGRVFGDVTSQISGMKFATILDDAVKSAPIINGAITGGRCTIHLGRGDPQRVEAERNDLVNVLKTGSLPAPLRESTHSDVGPTLGRDAIDKAKLSFAIGILLVVLIMVGIYRWSGWIAVFAVVFHILMTMAVMALFGAVLTLPGIAAIVLSIGMEVDGNILIYERIRDELNLGKSVRGAIDLGFSRAFSAIFDGQITTGCAGLILLLFGSGPIVGFAKMMLVGVFTTLATNIWVTRILFDWNVARKKGHIVTISI